MPSLVRTFTYLTETGDTVARKEFALFAQLMCSQRSDVGLFNRIDYNVDTGSFSKKYLKCKQSPAEATGPVQRLHGLFKHAKRGLRS